MNRNFSTIPVVLGVLFCFVSFDACLAEETPAQQKPVAKTTADPEIPLDELELQLVPMTTEELFVESEAWHELLKSSVFELSKVKLKVKRDNLVIKETGNSPTASEAVAEDKDSALEQIAIIREHRTLLIDRLNAVLNELSRKNGLTDDGNEKEEVLEYRRFVKSVGGLKVDVYDTKSTRATLVSWVTSREGGIRWARHIAVFLSSIVGFWLLGILLSKLAGKALAFSQHTTVMLKQFVISSIRRVMIFIGFLIGLSALEVNIAPVLAVIGATGFVVAFALQDTLSNFASGLMIMLYRPFDVNDLVDVSGVMGKVRSMTLVSTTIMTPDNKLMIVPNNSIWGNVITNSTGSSKRRVDLVFGISYNDDIDAAQKAMEEILAEHSQVLDDPEPRVRLHELADSSVNFICRPWVKTSDYWDVYWDITRQVKERFDRDGISIPFPQRDVHYYTENVGEKDPSS
ncbi:mechanosensitive ion channel family protein [Pseudomonadota bacterium]